jgi:hypothetical protein
MMVVSPSRLDEEQCAKIKNTPFHFGRWGMTDENMQSCAATDLVNPK